MYCPKCGTENADDAQVCRSCSWALTNVTTADAAPAPAAKTSGLAIASLVLGLLSPLTCFLTAIPAIILGIVSLVKISGSAGRLKGSGLAIAGIAVPPVCLPLVAIMMGILMPALARTRQFAFRIVCSTNMVALSKAMLIYSNDYGQNPTPEKWCDLLIEHVEVTPEMFRCKGAPEGPSNYAINKHLEEFDGAAPAGTVLLFETYPGWNQAGGPEILTTENHEGDGCNIVFVDGHAEFVRTQTLNDLRWKPD
ncbi:MAG: hypothetical protein CEE38_04105 [Planctomycetes bacterium B3_Pla]|nr:MAG: hypothetical protein CEE38_04105 [Planctomycetes bacterium B3_Pla]